MKTIRPLTKMKRGARLCSPRVLLLLALTCALAHLCAAQQGAQSISTAAEAAASSSSKDERDAKTDGRYRIGPGDVLDIRVFNKPQFSRDGVRVDARGMIRMPLIKGEIKAACHTEGELSEELTGLYQDYLRQPQVDVFIKEYQSQFIAVLGAVHKPSRLQLQHRIRLLDALTYSDGSTEQAGRSIQVVHTLRPSSICEEEPATADAGEAADELDSYNLAETLRGEEAANPYLRSGDVINIPAADQVFVVGNVLRPSPLMLREMLTISRAIAMVGGTLPDTKSDRVRIIRQSPGSATKTEIIVNLKAIEKKQAEDVALQPNDIVDVPTSGGKRLLRSIVGSVVPAVGQLPVRVIP